MIFTIGYRENYDRGIAEHGADFKKMGKRDSFRGAPYGGGSVWETQSEADQYLRDNQPRLMEYAVYGVLADWHADTEQIDGEPFRRLLRDAQVVSVEMVQ